MFSTTKTNSRGFIKKLVRAGCGMGTGLGEDTVNQEHRSRDNMYNIPFGVSKHVSKLLAIFSGVFHFIFPIFASSQLTTLLGCN